MPKVQFPLSNGYYFDEAQRVSAQECLNLFPSIPETVGSISQNVLRAPAGLSAANIGSGGGSLSGIGRASIVMNNILYLVIGNSLYEVVDNGQTNNIPNIDLVQRGTGIAGTERVAISENNFVITIVIPGTATGYFYDRTDFSFVEITDQVFVDYGIKLDVTYKDGYFIYLTPREYFLSSLVIDNNGKNFDALDFSTAEISTDDNVAIANIKNELFIFGGETIEVFQNTGGDFPFQRIPGATVDRGVIAPFSVIPFQNTYLFIGAGENEGISIWEGLSGQSRRISTPAIDDVLQNVPIDILRDAFAFKYSESGNFFCGFTVPGVITLVYDQTTSQIQNRPIWHRRASSNDGSGDWRVSHIEQAYNANFVLDNDDQRIGVLNQNIFTEYGERVLRRFDTVYVYSQGNRFRVSDIELKTQLGETAFSISTDNQISMQISEDFGNSFQPVQVQLLPSNTSSLTRAVWYNQGLFETSLVMRFDVVSDQKIAHYDGLINSQVLG